ncbi:MAG TPA: ABC transporter permease [Fulvivirga sp.]|nr:ABC transporter permease [Fulvivirga sp.]
MFDIDKAISNWLKSLRKHRAFDDGEIREMELHIRDHIEDLMSEGLSKKEAFDKAISEFGEVSEMAQEEFTTQRRKPTIKSFLFSTMLNNYTKTSYRRLLKHPVSSLINILGIAIAIGICVLVYSFGFWVENIDQHHENKDNVYLTTAFINRSGKMQQWGISPRPIGEMMKEDFQQIQNVCRIQENNVVIKLDDKVFQESISFVDPSYLQIFTFPLSDGYPSSLNDKSSIILSTDMAKKYFGENNPIGQDLLVTFNSNEKKAFKVTGVAKKFPSTHAIGFDFLINYGNLDIALPNYNPDDWTQSIGATLIQVKDQEQLAAIDQGMEKYKQLQNAAMEDWKVDSFKFEQLATLYQRSPDINKTISSRYYNTNKMAHNILTILAIFMLALASVNYINISIATAAKRLKEIALRKTIGANRIMVVFQHLTENILTTVLALILGMAFGKFILVPWFEYQNGYSSGFYILDINLWLYLGGVMLVTALISGLYPSLYISSFQAVNIFRGKVKFGKGNLVTKGLLGFQLILSSILIVCAIMFTENGTYLRERSWGYNPSSVLYAQVDNWSSYDKFRNNMQQYANVQLVSGGSDHIGVHKSLKVLRQQEKEFEVSSIMIDPNYLELMGLQIVRGRDFAKSLTADKYSLIVNEKFIEQLSIKNPIDEVFEIDSAKYTIVGVVKDFHYSTFSNEIEPMIFMLADEENYRSIVLKVAQGTEMESLGNLKKEWASLFPEVPFRGGLQEDVWGGYFASLKWHGEFWRMIAYVTVFMAALGLFGLISLNVSGRVKEFSIKKVLGARILHLGKNIVNDYMWLFTLSIILGAPISYYLVGFFFDMVYPYHIPSNFGSVIISGTILIVVLWAVVSILLVRVAKSNPVIGLKEE